MAGLSYDPDERARYEYAADDEGGIPPVARSIPTPPRNPKPERAEWRQESDLQAQWDAARWTFWGAVIAAFGTAVALVGVFFIRETLRHTASATKAAGEAALAAGRSADIAERQLTEADRGRVYVEALTSVSFRDSTREPDKEIPQLAILIRNVGTRWITIRSARVEFIEAGDFFVAEDRPTPPVKFKRPGGFPSIYEPLVLKPDGEEQVDIDTGHPLEGNEYRTWGLYILGLVRYTDHLNILRESGFCFRWHPTDEESEGFVGYVWSYDDRVKPEGQ
jgi:hypothetical protein